MNSIQNPNSLRSSFRGVEGIRKGINNSNQPLANFANNRSNSAKFNNFLLLASQFFNKPKNLVMGTNSRDVLLGTNKADKIVAKGGDDLIFAGKGNDNISGGRGNDVIFDGRGDDRVNGGAGNDTFIIGKGNNKIFGGKGEDLAIFNGDRADYSMVTQGDNTVVTNKKTGQVNTLRNVESIKFNDTTVFIVPKPPVVTVPPLVGTPRDEPIDLPKSSEWISQISDLFGSMDLPMLADAGLATMVSQADSESFKDAIIKQLETGDYALAHNLFQALDNPLYPRNRSLLERPHLNDFINYVKSADATAIKEAVVSNLPNDIFIPEPMEPDFPPMITV